MGVNGRNTTQPLGRESGGLRPRRRRHLSPRRPISRVRRPSFASGAIATTPIRRVFTGDMEAVYRTDLSVSQRDSIDRTLSSGRGSLPKVRCAWSDPGDHHAAIISYTGLIRQHLTLGPEDPRFQASCVGFGTDFDAVETHATTINRRFSSENDRSGFEMLLLGRNAALRRERPREVVIAPRRISSRCIS